MAIITDVFKTLASAAFLGKNGKVSIVKCFFITPIVLAALPAVLSLLLLTWPAGPALLGVGGLLLIGKKSIDRLLSKDSKDAKSSNIFGKPSRAEIDADKTATLSGKTYVNFKTLAPKIARQYGFEVLNNFKPKKLGITFTNGQQKESDAKFLNEAAESSFLRLARDQLANLIELHKQGNFDRPVPVKYRDDVTKKTSQIQVPYAFMVAGQRKTILEMIKIDREANTVPLVAYNGEKKKEDIKQCKFAKGIEIGCGQNPAAETFSVASRMPKDGEWSQNGDVGMTLATAFYNYTAGKLAGQINEDVANAYDLLFSTKDKDELWANCQIYADLCKWGAIGHKVRIAIATKAQIEAKKTGDYSLYNFTMYCLSNNDEMARNQPWFDGVRHDFEPAASRFLNSIRNGSPAANNGSPGLYYAPPANNGATCAVMGDRFNECSRVLTKELAGQGIATQLDAIRAEATKDLFGQGTQKLATNIASLQGLASGIDNELLIGELGWDKIRIALQNPDTRVFVAQGAIATTQKFLSQMLELAR